MTATLQTNGQLPGDYAYCTPGELLWLPPMCDASRRNPDDRCGCGRGFGGLHSHRATTTALVEDLPYSTADLEIAVGSSLAEQGWVSTRRYSCRDREIVAEVIDELRSIAEHFEVGDVLRKRGEMIYRHSDVAAG